MCIQELCGLSMSDQPLSLLSDCEMTWPYHIPVFSAGTLWHVDYFTSFL